MNDNVTVAITSRAYQKSSLVVFDLEPMDPEAKLWIYVRLLKKYFFYVLIQVKMFFKGIVNKKYFYVLCISFLCGRYIMKNIGN